MRNLSLSATELVAIPNTNITGTAIDLDEKVLYVVSEKDNADGEVEVELWKLSQNNKDEQVNFLYHCSSDLSNALQAAVPRLFCMISAIVSSANPAPSQIASFRVLPENRRIALVMRFGDIITVSLDGEDPIVCCVLLLQSHLAYTVS